MREQQTFAEHDSVEMQANPVIPKLDESREHVLDVGQAGLSMLVRTENVTHVLHDVSGALACSSRSDSCSASVSASLAIVSIAAASISKAKAIRATKDSAINCNLISYHIYQVFANFDSSSTMKIYYGDNFMICM